MTTPVDERPEPTYSHPSHGITSTSTLAGQGRTSLESRRESLPSYNIHNKHQSIERRQGSSEDGTMVGDSDEHGHHPQLARKSESGDSQRPDAGRLRRGSHLTVETQYEPGDPLRTQQSPSQTREQAHRLDDDLQLLKIERQISKQDEDELSRTKSAGGETYRSKSRKRDDHVDEFDEATNPVHEKAQIYKPVENPATGFARFLKRVHQSNFLIRWLTYIVPLVLILLIPLLLGAFVFTEATVGGVYLMWFMIWLEIVWLTLWAGRVLAKCLPWPIGIISSFFTNNSKKWRDMGKQLELPATLFFWWLAIEISFLPTMTNHQMPPQSGTQSWMSTMNKVLVSFFVGATLNFAEKIIIQLIAISFHLRTYADRIDINKFQIGSLTKLYTFSKAKIQMEDAEFEYPAGQEPGSGARTPGQIMNEAAKQGKQALSKFGDVAGKVAGDFTGKAVVKSTHPQQVVLTLLGSIAGAQVLARRLYRTFAREDTETVIADDLQPAFENEDESNAAFAMFDKDMNGDISMEELEAVCVEIGRERKSITASLKDLDSVVGKLDDVFMFLVFVIVILVFLSLISASAAGVLASAGSAVLALSWLFSATAQEFLQSVIFVFVKHPFDVGDRVGIYGNTGALLRGDDYFVKEIALLYTEFKKMEGHIVQAPNSYLNTLFILNQRRSGGLAEAVTINIKFGTTLEQLEGLRNKLLEFVKTEKREYQGNILTELREIVEVHSMNLNVVFFYKSNWQNEGLRLARRNKFFCALMVTIQELGIEGPYMRFPGMRESFPMYLSQVPHMATAGAGHGGSPDNPHGLRPEDPMTGAPHDPPFVAPEHDPEHPSTTQPEQSRMRSASILKSGRARGESLSAMGKRVDFSLGMRSYAAMGDMAGDVYEDRTRDVPLMNIVEASRERSRTSQDRARASAETARSSGRDNSFAHGGLARRSTTDSRFRSSQSVHRNRFFGRSGHGTGDGATEEDLAERGIAMANIPEESRLASATNTPGGGGGGNQHIDPRTGMVSPAAMRMDTGQSGGLPLSTGGEGVTAAAVPAVAPQLPRQVSGSGALGVGPPPPPSVVEGQVGGLGRSRTEDFGVRGQQQQYRS